MGTALSVACSWGQADLVRLLLGRGADVNATGSEQFSPLSSAARGGHSELVRLLLDRGAGAGDALSAACAAGRPDVARLLLGCGADVNVVGKDHYSPARCSCKRAAFASLCACCLIAAPNISGGGGGGSSSSSSSAYRYGAMSSAAGSGHAEV